MRVEAPPKLPATFNEVISRELDGGDGYFHSLALVLKEAAKKMDGRDDENGTLAQALRKVWLSGEPAKVYMLGYQGSDRGRGFFNDFPTYYRVYDALAQEAPHFAYPPFIARVIGKTQESKYTHQTSLLDDFDKAQTSDSLKALLMAIQIEKYSATRIPELQSFENTQVVPGSEETFWRYRLLSTKPGSEGIFFHLGFTTKGAQVIVQKAEEVFGEEFQRGLIILNAVIYLKTNEAAKVFRPLGVFRQPVLAALSQNDLDTAESLVKEAVLAHPDLFTETTKNALGISQEDIEQYQEQSGPLTDDQKEEQRRERLVASILAIQEQRAKDTDIKTIIEAEKLIGHLLYWEDRETSGDHEWVIPRYAIVVGRATFTPKTITEVVDDQGTIVRRTSPNVPPLPAMNCRYFSAKTGEFNVNTVLYPGTLLKKGFIDLGDVAELFGPDYDSGKVMQLPLDKVTRKHDDTVSLGSYETVKRRIPTTR